MEKLKITNDLYNNIKHMVSSDSDDDILFVLNLIEGSDRFDRETQLNIEKLYELLHETQPLKNLHALKTRAMLANMPDDLD